MKRQERFGACCTMELLPQLEDVYNLLRVNSAGTAELWFRASAARENAHRGDISADVWKWARRGFGVRPVRSRLMSESVMLFISKFA